MTPAWSLRSAHALGPVRVGVRAGQTEAVTLAGELVYRTPLPVAAARRWLRALGATSVAGPLPDVLRIRACGTAFQLKVWQACRRIPPGQKRTYGQLAEAVGCRSAQAVGAALGANPLAGIIPCHRVVAATGLGGFAWGTARKRAWLEAEADGPAR
jgi:methylated-DNA-[protein]-cysteine S-methyltransferase